MTPPPRGLLFFLLSGFPIGTLLFLLLFVAESRRDGEDCWWHLAAGRELLKTDEGVSRSFTPSALLQGAKKAPMKDPFSFTARDRTWINPEWLSQMIFFALFSRENGERCLVFLKIILLTVAFLLLIPIGILRGSSPAPAAFAVLGTAWVSWYFFDLRPEIFTFLNFALLLLFLEGARRRGPFLLLPLPLLFLLWANLHGGFFLGLMILLLSLLLPLKRKREKISGLPVLLATVLSTCATMVNPYGLGLLLFPFDYFHTSFTNTVEWSSPFSPEGGIPPAFWILAAAALLSLLNSALSSSRRSSFFHSSLLLLTLAMSLWARRFIPIFCMAYAPQLGKDLTLLFRWLFKGVRGWKELPFLLSPILGWATAALAVFIALLPLVEMDDLFSHTVNIKGFFPCDAVSFIQKNRLKGNMFNEYTFGGFLIYHLYPETRVFIDGRGNMVYDDEIFEDYIDVLRVKETWSAILGKYSINFLVLGPQMEKLTAFLHHSPVWTLVFADYKAQIFVRNAPENEGLLKNLEEDSLFLPNPLHFYICMGHLSLKYGEFEKARVLLEKALALEPRNAMIHDSLGVTYLRMEDPQRAKEEFQKAVDLDPNLAEAYHHLGSLFLYEKNYKEAAKNLERAVALKPDSKHAVEDLSWTYFMLGRRSDGIRMKQKANTLSEN